MALLRTDRSFVGKSPSSLIEQESGYWRCIIQPSILTHYFVFWLFLVTSLFIWGFVIYQMLNIKWMLNTFQKFEFVKLILYWLAGGALSQALILKEYQHQKKQFLDSNVFNYQNSQSVLQHTAASEHCQLNNLINQPKIELILYAENQLAYNSAYNTSSWQIERKMFFPFGVILHLTALDKRGLARKTLWLAKDQFSTADWRTLHFHLRQSKHAF